MADKRAKASAPALQASPQALNKLLEDKEPINPVLKLKFKAIFDKFENLVKLSSTQLTATRYKLNKDSVFDPAPSFLREQSVSHVRTFSPLELIGTAVLVSYHMEDRSDEELLNDVRKFRHYLRMKHKDLRVNPQCWSTAWTFISSLGTDAEPTGAGSRLGTGTKSARGATKRRPRASNGAKTKAGPRAKKPQINRRKKVPPRPSRSRVANGRRSHISPSSSELSSAPSSGSDDASSNGSRSPFFPSLMPNKTVEKDPVDQAEAVTPAVTEEDTGVTSKLSSSVVKSNSNTGKTQSEATLVSLKDSLATQPITTTPVSQVVADDLVIESVNAVLTGELMSRTETINDLIVKEPTSRPSEDLSKLPEANTDSLPLPLIINGTSKSEATRPMDALGAQKSAPEDEASQEEVEHVTTGAQNLDGNALSIVPEAPNHDESDIFRVRNALPKPANGLEPKINSPRTVNPSGVNIPPKSKSRFKPKAPPRDYRRLNTPSRASDITTPSSLCGDGPPTKRPHDGMIESLEHSPKKSKESVL